MSELRRPLAPSQGSLTASSSSIARPPKRRLTSSELDFFTPAASSFKPRPYTPNSVPACDPLTEQTPVSRNQSRSLETLALPPAGMDPQPSDPAVVFIHPPFTTFPGSRLCPDGLSYPLMADNPEWFLDADDFISQNNPNPRAIPYPPHLEPPRGWCPAKKKDLRDRGSEGWPEGEEPRLRCTFCRRTYAGVNAKSMWRRHVFEKHKIAMSNRRDGADRPRGRGSNKENRQLSAPKNPDAVHDRLVNMSVAPQTEPRNVSHKSRFRSLPFEEETRRRRDRSGKASSLSSSQETTQDESPNFTEDDDACRLHPPPGSQVLSPSPPLTPQSALSSDPANSSVKHSEGPMSPLAHPVIPPSPYDPLLTPSFRHSPPRLPSDQPWRFPSPSHPLHSRSRELSLSMLIRDLNSPITKVPAVIYESPSRIVRISPLSSTRATGSGLSRSSPLGPERSESSGKLSTSSPRALFTRGQLGQLRFPMCNDRNNHRIEESPLRTSSRIVMHRKSNSASSNHWLPEGLLVSSTSLTTELMANNDPFVNIYNSFDSINSVDKNTTREKCSPPLSSPEIESPVLRSSGLPTGVGLGIGLLEPFSLPKDGSPPLEGSDFDGMSIADGADGAEAVGVMGASSKGSVSHETTPPLKKRKMSRQS